MTKEEIKFECLKMAVSMGANTSQEALASAEKFLKWIEG